ncbi:MAG: 50S ribosomal protein L10 [Candidatus Shikimatogenerans sp. JK-2022]|nr:50S ribosomal protein L10 [Candidatus Shikimatogenerans bostrichidophilus]
MINKKKKNEIINYFKKKILIYKNFYIINFDKINNIQLFNFRKICFLKNVKIFNIKNKLLKIILKNNKKYNKILSFLINNNYIMFSKIINLPANIIKYNKIIINNIEYPILKIAYINDNLYYNNDLNLLCNIKTKNELIIDIFIKFKSIINNLLYVINYNIDLLKLIKILYINKYK